MVDLRWPKMRSLDPRPRSLIPLPNSFSRNAGRRRWIMHISTSTRHMTMLHDYLFRKSIASHHRAIHHGIYPSCFPD